MYVIYFGTTFTRMAKDVLPRLDLSIFFRIPLSFQYSSFLNLDTSQDNNIVTKLCNHFMACKLLKGT